MSACEQLFSIKLLELRHGQKMSSKKKLSISPKSARSNTHRSPKRSPLRSERLTSSQVEIRANSTFPVVKVERMSSEVFSRPQSVSALSPPSGSHYQDFTKSEELCEGESHPLTGEQFNKQAVHAFQKSLVKEEPVFSPAIYSFKEEPGGTAETASHGHSVKSQNSCSDDVFMDKYKKARGFDSNENDIALKHCFSEDDGKNLKPSLQEQSKLFSERIFDSRHRDFMGETVCKLPETGSNGERKHVSDSERFPLFENDKRAKQKDEGSNSFNVPSATRSSVTENDSWKHKHKSKSEEHSKKMERGHHHHHSSEIVKNRNSKDSKISHHRKSSSKRDKSSSRGSSSSDKSKKHKSHHHSHSSDIVSKKPKSEPSSDNCVPAQTTPNSYQNQTFVLSNVKREKLDDESNAMPVVEYTDSVVKRAEPVPVVPDMQDEAACAVEALNSQDLVEKFEKLESNLQVTQLNIQNKIKVQDETHIFQIDNRSSTPILHIPSPKAEMHPFQYSSVESESCLSSNVNSSGSVASSRPNSKPPSRANSRPPSRQHSQPATPLVKTETLFQEDIDKQLIKKLDTIQEPCTTSVVKPVVTSNSVALTTTVTKSTLSKSKKAIRSQFIPCRGEFIDDFCF